MCIRDRIQGIRRANVAILTRADSIDEPQKQKLRQHYQSRAKHLTWLESTCKPTRLVAASGDSLPVSALTEQKVVAFCAIGNPAGFRSTLRSVHCEPAAWIEFPDHHEFTSKDLASIQQAMTSHNGTMLVCTGKDLAKLPNGIGNDQQLFALEIENEIQPVEELERYLHRIVAGAA